VLETADTGLPEVKLLRAPIFGDQRGWFSEVFNARTWAGDGIEDTFVQDNQSYSENRLTLRGLHFQVPPYAQAKIVRCLRGRLLDVAVDLRRQSPRYGRWCMAELSAENRWQMYIPSGFAHGFLTLTPGTEVLYKVSNIYAPQHDRGVHWNDPDIGIEWGVDPDTVTVSDKDTHQPGLADLPAYF
jgi:dTDP-4-dehydrorhamnose 3,5-epimerase